MSECNASQWGECNVAWATEVLGLHGWAGLGSCAVWCAASNGMHKKGEQGGCRMCCECTLARVDVVLANMCHPLAGACIPPIYSSICLVPSHLSQLGIGLALPVHAPCDKNAIHCCMHLLRYLAHGSVTHLLRYLAHGTATDFMFRELKVPLAYTWEIYGDLKADSDDCFRMFNPIGKEQFEVRRVLCRGESVPVA